MDVIRARSEAAHKAERANQATFETTRRETTQFVLAIVANIWFHELQETESLYTKVGPKALLSHLQAGCTGRHALNLLTLNSWDFRSAAGWYVGVAL